MKLTTWLLADARHAGRRLFRAVLFYGGALFLILIVLWFGWSYLSDWVGNFFHWPSWAHLPQIGWPDWLGGSENASTPNQPQSTITQMLPATESVDTTTACTDDRYLTVCWKLWQ